MAGDKNEQSDVKPPAPGATVVPPAAAPGQTQPAATPPATPVDPDAARAARLEEIDRELVAADKVLAATQNQIQSLRNERDELRRQGLGPPMTQAEALAAIVKSDQEQRMNRAAIAAAVTGLVGSSRMPTVKTPAEIKAAMTRKPIQVPPITPPQK